MSIAAIVRAAVDRELDRDATARQTRMRRALEAMDRAFRSGYSDISRRHDDHLAEIYAE
jgi:hypothetical protein